MGQFGTTTSPGAFGNPPTSSRDDSTPQEGGKKCYRIKGLRGTFFQKLEGSDMFMYLEGVFYTKCICDDDPPRATCSDATIYAPDGTDNIETPKEFDAVIEVKEYDLPCPPIEQTTGSYDREDPCKSPEVTCCFKRKFLVDSDLVGDGDPCAIDSDFEIWPWWLPGSWLLQARLQRSCNYRIGKWACRAKPSGACLGLDIVDCAVNFSHSNPHVKCEDYQRDWSPPGGGL